MNPHAMSAARPKPAPAVHVMNDGYNVKPSNLYNESIAAKMLGIAVAELTAMRRNGSFPKPTVLTFGKPTWKGSVLIAYLKANRPAA